MNNYDNNATMENCELACFLDTSVSQMDFDDNFKIIEHSSYSKTCLAFYMGPEDKQGPDTVSACYDLSKCTRKDYRAFCIAQSNLDTLDVIRERIAHFYSWEECALELMDCDLSVYDCCLNEFPDINNAQLLYNVVSIQGYSQGDYALVIYQIEEGFLSNEGQARKVFCNLFYDAPVYCRLTVDGEEVFLEEGLKDTYVYDEGEILEYAKKQGLSEEVLSWLENSLPEHPESA